VSARAFGRRRHEGPDEAGLTLLGDPGLDVICRHDAGETGRLRLYAETEQVLRMELLQHRGITDLGHVVALRLAVVGRTVRRARTSRPREGGERGAGGEDDEGEDKMFEPEGRSWHDQAFASGADEEVEDRPRCADEGEHEPGKEGHRAVFQWVIVRPSSLLAPAAVQDERKDLSGADADGAPDAELVERCPALFESGGPATQPLTSKHDPAVDDQEHRRRPGAGKEGLDLFLE